MTQRNLLKHAGEQFHADSGQFHVELARRPAAGKRQRLLGGDVAGVDAFVDPMDGHGSLAIVMPIGAENPVNTAVPGERRGVHIESSDAGGGEHVCAKNHRKRRDDYDVGLEPPNLAGVDQGNTEAG